MLTMIERFKEVAPPDWQGSGQPRRLGFIKGVPQGSADQQREWMYSMGVHPFEQFLDNQIYKGMDGLDDALLELDAGHEFYLWSPHVLRPPRSMDALVARVYQVGAKLIIKERWQVGNQREHRTADLLTEAKVTRNTVIDHVGKRMGPR